MSGDVKETKWRLGQAWSRRQKKKILHHPILSYYRSHLCGFADYNIIIFQISLNNFLWRINQLCVYLVHASKITRQRCLLNIPWVTYKSTTDRNHILIIPIIYTKETDLTFWFNTVQLTKIKWKLIIPAAERWPDDGFKTSQESCIP